MDCKYNIDWINGILPVTELKPIEDFLNTFPCISRDHWVESPGRFNYVYGIEFSGMPGFRFCYNYRSFYQQYGDEQYRQGDEFRDPENTGYIPSKGEHNNAYVFVSVSGDAIRMLQHFNVMHDFMLFLYAFKFRCTRFDVNCDIFDKDNEVVDLICEASDYFVNPVRGKPTFRSKYFRRQNKTIRVQQNYDFVLNQMTRNVSIGNHGSMTGMFRCYNKRLEVFETKNAEVALELWRSHGEPEYWYRLEYELHKTSAENIFNAYMADGKYNNFSAFLSCFDMFFTIVDCVTHKNDYNPVMDVWLDFREVVCLQNNNFVALDIRNEKITNDEFIPSLELDKKFYLRIAGVIDSCMYLYDHDSDFRRRFDDRIQYLQDSENLRYIHRYSRAVSGL